MMVRHLGKIKISEKLLLAFLDYSEVSIRAASYEINTGTVDFILEGPEMPEVKYGSVISVVTPSYIEYQNALGHKVTLRDRGNK